VIGHQKGWARLYLFRGDRSLISPPECLDDPRVTPEVFLAANEEDGKATAKVLDLGDPLETR